jgi:hypothetical protein
MQILSEPLDQSHMPSLTLVLRTCNYFPHTYPSFASFLFANMPLQSPEFHGDGFDADWVSLVVLKNNWTDYHNNDWKTVAAKIRTLAHNDPPYPLPSADAGVYEVRLWAWKVFTLEKYGLVDHPAELLAMASKFTVTGVMLRDIQSAFSVGSYVGFHMGVTQESLTLARLAIWEWLEKGRSYEKKRKSHKEGNDSEGKGESSKRKSPWVEPFKWLFGRKEDNAEKSKDTRIEERDLDMKDKDDSFEELPPYKR